MLDPFQVVVTYVLSRHLAAPPGDITQDAHLVRDLDLDGLDLALIGLRLEDYYGAEFPFGRLEQAETVADLTELVREWAPLDLADDDDDRDTLPSSSVPSHLD
jgi:acyl carrier protein